MLAKKAASSLLCVLSLPSPKKSGNNFAAASKAA